MNFGNAGRRVGGALLLVGVVAVVVLALVIWCQRANIEDDALQVYCFAPAQRGNLINAAAALGMTVPNPASARDVADWRARRPEDFVRACEALSAAQRPPGTGLFATVLPFLTGLTGAVAAFVAAAWRDRVTRGHTIADDLRSAFEGFRRAAETYLDGWSASRSDVQVVERRATLLTQLARARAAHPGWTAVRQVERILTNGDLGSDMTVGWKDGSAGWEQRDNIRENDLRSLLERVQDKVLRIADALEQPFGGQP